MEEDEINRTDVDVTEEQIPGRRVPLPESFETGPVQQHSSSSSNSVVTV